MKPPRVACALFRICCPGHCVLHPDPTSPDPAAASLHDPQGAPFAAPALPVTPISGDAFVYVYTCITFLEYRKLCAIRGCVPGDVQYGREGCWGVKVLPCSRQ